MFTKPINLIITTAVVVVSTIIPLQHASASKVSNGVNCSKANLTTKVGSKLYRCAKNPIIKPERNTWTLSSCLRTSKIWMSAKNELSDWRAIIKNPDDKTTKALNDLESLISELEATMREEVCKKGS